MLKKLQKINRWEKILKLNSLQETLVWKDLRKLIEMIHLGILELRLIIGVRYLLILEILLKLDQYWNKENLLQFYFQI